MDEIVAANKRIIQQYIEAVNSKNESLIFQLIHDDYKDPDPIIGVSVKTNPWPKFLKLLGFKQKIIDYMDNPVDSKSELIAEELIWTNILINRKIESIIAEKDVVAVIRSATLNDPKKLNLSLTSFQRYWIKEGKIISYESVTRFLPTLFQLESIIIEQNDPVKIDDYLSWLRDSDFFSNQFQS